MRIYNKKNIDLERAKKLIKTFDTEKAEFKKEEVEKKEVNKEKISQEVARNMKLSNLMEYNFNLSNPTKPQGYNPDIVRGQFGGFSKNGNDYKSFPSGGIGQTVSSFERDQFSSELSNRWGQKYALKPSEALLVAIKRALSSGAPVNDIGFYDEINWYLNNIGFDPKSPLDIKTAILKIIEDRI
jgi:hypothetical protein